jgi:hypothetical protein
MKTLHELVNNNQEDCKLQDIAMTFITLTKSQNCKMFNFFFFISLKDDDDNEDLLAHSFSSKILIMSDSACHRVESV